MDAERVAINSTADELRLRAKVRGPLVFDTENPDAAVVCPDCDNVVALVDSSILVGNDTAQCFACDALNTVWLHQVVGV